MRHAVETLRNGDMVPALAVALSFKTNEVKDPQI
jgi:hypothetical protein